MRSVYALRLLSPMEPTAMAYLRPYKRIASAGLTWLGIQPKSLSQSLNPDYAARKFAENARRKDT